MKKILESFLNHLLELMERLINQPFLKIHRERQATEKRKADYLFYLIPLLITLVFLAGLIVGSAWIIKSFFVH